MMSMPETTQQSTTTMVEGETILAEPVTTWEDDVHVGEGGN